MTSRPHVHPRLSPHRSSRGRYWPWLIPGVTAFTAVVIVALIWNVWLSFTEWNGFGTPVFVGFENYETLATDPVFWQSFRNAVAFIFAMAIVPTVVGLVVSAALFDYIAPRFGNPAATIMRTAFFIPQIVPIAIAGMVWTWLLSSQYGVVNVTLEQWGLGSLAQNWLGEPQLALPSVMVVMVWIQLGYTIVIFMSGLARADQSVHEAAAIDGASWFQRFRAITLRQLVPEISVVLLTTTVSALKVFAPVYVMTQGGPGTATQVPAYFSYFNFIQTGKVGYGAAIATVLALLLVAIALFLLRLQSRRSEDQ
jgi:raffinose/stachyose/melibiose transport system permease protein